MVRCIMETPESGYGVDFCREPVDCNVCSDVSIYQAPLYSICILQNKPRNVHCTNDGVHRFEK